MQKPDVQALAIALDVSWAACMLLAGWISIFGWGYNVLKKLDRKS